jgi:hypothetical protein
MDVKTKKLLNSKLRQPVHISYISKYILKITEEETKKILNELIDEDVIEESPLASNYYINKKI